MGAHRRTLKCLRGLTAAAGALLAGFAYALPANAEDAAAPKSPVLVELFLSQACNMCPPAAALFHDTAAQEGVVALSWHVDYWNMTSSEHGRWIDPYSHATFTKRQKRYNMNIRQRSSIYTPQVIVHGAAQAVGTKQEMIQALIADAPAKRTPIAATSDNQAVRFEVGESPEGGNAYLVTFQKQLITDVTSGKNAGKTFNEVNVVTDVTPLGVVRRRGATFSAPAPQDGEGCALIVEQPGQTGVVAAAYCAG